MKLTWLTDIHLNFLESDKRVEFYSACCNDCVDLRIFSSKVMGDVLMDTAQANLDIEFLVLCGHTHGEAEFLALDNLTVRAGGAEYYRPVIQAQFHLA